MVGLLSSSNRRRAFQIPRTSAMVKRPGPLPRPHRAALTAPRAKMPRSVAMWLSTTRSPSAAKRTLCSPTTLPPRSVANPMSPRFLAPVWPSRERTLVSASETAAPFRRRLAEHQRGAGWRVDLVLVVHFEHLDVEVGVERCGDLARQCDQQVDAEAHVAGLDDRRVARRGLDRRFMLGREARRADDVDDARVGGETGDLDADVGHREIEDAIHLATMSSGSSVILTPRLPTPASRPASPPSAIEPGRSIAPAMTAAPFDACTVRISSCPMRPAAPIIASFIALIGLPLLNLLRPYSTGPRPRERATISSRARPALRRRPSGRLGVPRCRCSGRSPRCRRALCRRCGHG